MTAEPTLLHTPARPILPFSEFVDLLFRPQPEQALGEALHELQHSECHAAFGEYHAHVKLNVGRWIHRDLSEDQVVRGLNRLNYTLEYPLPEDVQDLLFQGTVALHFDLWEPNVTEGCVADPNVNDTDLDSMCFLHWDNFYLRAPRTAFEREHHAAHFQLWERCLLSSRPRLQECAVHALGHIRNACDPTAGFSPDYDYFDHAGDLLQRFLEKREQINPFVIDRARQALTGQIL